MNEIERKFLVIRERMPLPVTGMEIMQGYVAIEPEGAEVRLREKGDKILLTVKSSGSMTRAEAETEITREQFDTLWPFTLGRRIEKMRYDIPLGGGLTCELDIFSGGLRGLVMAEVEFTDEDSAKAFQPPEWFGEEVTDDKRYKNKNLAVRGL